MPSSPRGHRLALPVPRHKQQRADRNDRFAKSKRYETVVQPFWEGYHAQEMCSHWRKSFGQRKRLQYTTYDASESPNAAEHGIVLTVQPLLANQTASLPAPHPTSMHVKGTLTRAKSCGKKKQTLILVASKAKRQKQKQGRQQHVAGNFLRQTSTHV